MPRRELAKPYDGIRNGTAVAQQGARGLP